ncbi:hypothetical protein EBR21_08850, partial [bacterium]|nr:hypothetical protein [bacterium]
MFAETTVTGGLSSIQVSHTSLATTIGASPNNLTINSISLFSSLGGNQIAWSGNTTDVVRIRVFAQGNPSDIVSTGVNEYQTLSFVNGVSSTPVQLSLLRTGNFTLNVSVRDREYQTNFVVVPLPAYSIQLRMASGINYATAGSQFTIYASVRDIYGNKTSLPAGTASNCDLTMSGGNTVNTTVHGFATFAPNIPSSPRPQDNTQTWDNNWPNYAPWALTLYAKGSNTITVSGCGLTASLNVNVDVADLDKVTLNTQNDPLVTHTTEKICANVDSASANVRCDRVYAFFWDQYGNSFGDSVSCDSWQLTAKSSNVPSNPLPARFALVEHSTYLDADLTCTKGSKQATMLLYGGTSRLEFINNYTANSKNNITAALGNLEVSSIRMFQRKNNIEIPKVDASFGILTFATNSSLSLTQLGQSANVVCTIGANGQCTGFPILFNFTKAETTNLSVSMFGLTQNIPTINVIPAPPTRTEDITISGIPTSANAGVGFTVGVSVRDQFGNLTANSCGQLAVTGGQASPGQHGTTATSPQLPANAAQGSTGVYPNGSVTLYKEGNNT